VRTFFDRPRSCSSVSVGRFEAAAHFAWIKIVQWRQCRTEFVRVHENRSVQQKVMNRSGLIPGRGAVFYMFGADPCAPVHAAGENHPLRAQSERWCAP